MARRYVEAMRGVQPRGPYRLGGWSFGALVAFEMACQLRVAGEEVAALVVLDLPAPVGGDAMDFLVEQFRMFGICVERGPHTSPGDIAAHLAEALVRFGVLPGALAETERQRRVYRAHLEALLSYQPRPYDGPLALLRARELRAGASPSAAASDPTYGWGALCARVTVHAVAGNHFNMVFEPHARELAAVLRRLLDGELVR